MSEWISVKDRMPPLPKKWSDSRRWIATDGKNVREMCYVAHESARTDKGRAPRWEETYGRLSYMHVTHWQPLPPPPAEGE